MARNKTSQFLVAFLFLSVILVSCIDDEDENSSQTNNEDDNTEELKSNGDEESGCKFRDGTHSATVEYFNPDTGYEATYTLDVEVANCEVTEIDFPKGGWLNGDHIDATEIDSDGDASVEDDRGRSFDVHIDE